jgi:hypothetical protein
MTLKDIDRVLAFLAAWYPHSPLPPDSEDLWAQTLEHLPADGVWNRLQRYVLDSSHRYPPLLADILVEPLTDQAEQAWLQVMDAVRRLGAYRTPQWDDPAIDAAIRACGGWTAVCRSENMAADRAHFLRYYTAYRQRINQNTWQDFWHNLPSRPASESLTDTRIANPEPDHSTIPPSSDTP